MLTKCTGNNQTNHFGHAGLILPVRFCVSSFLFGDIMSKRFTDTEKWKDDWFFSLTANEKLLWFYILDNCDHAGIWKASWSQVSIFIGHITDISKFDSRMIQVKQDTYFIPKFLVYQYGNEWWKSKIRAHLSAVKILKSIGIFDKAKELTNSYLTLSKPLANSYGYGYGYGNGYGNGHDNEQQTKQQKVVTVGESK